VAGRLTGLLRDQDHAARLGGDEFAVLLPGVEEPAAVGIARRIIDTLARPFRIAGHDVLIGASIGLARSGEAGTDGAKLLDAADVAMYHAKKAGTGHATVFDPAMQARALETLSLSSDLQHALTDQSLEVHFQPIVNLRTGRPVALEALARWRHLERGPVPPGVFVPLAEQTGLIVEFGRWVLRSSLGEAAAWHRAHPDVALSVNVSIRQLVEPTFAAEVQTMLDQAAFPPEMLVLELTENALMTHLDGALPCLHALGESGVRLALDDYGTSYSSLTHLRRFRVDELKIDGSFVRTMTSDTRDRAMVRAVLGLGRELGVATVAKGIETAEQLELLRANECELGQGYLLSRPMPASQLASYLSGTVTGTPLARLAG
jgi:predicted signal transduction protein with EAL and GGDEF domain